MGGRAETRQLAVLLEARGRMSHTRMEVIELARQWPYCYHITFFANLRSIVASRALYSATFLLSAAGLNRHCQLRTSEQSINVWGRQVVLRNQIALNPDSLALPESDSLEDYVAFLNERTYFWPGTHEGPVADGLRMFAAHATSRPPITIRARTVALIEQNQNAEILVATCNTGASWHDRDGKTWRRRDAVVPLSKYVGDPWAIAELSYRTAAQLPQGCQCSLRHFEGWEELR